jgi:hypothetical protein
LLDAALPEVDRRLVDLPLADLPLAVEADLLLAVDLVLLGLAPPDLLDGALPFAGPALEREARLALVLVSVFAVVATDPSLIGYDSCYPLNFGR